MTPFQERLGRLTVQWMSGLNILAYRLSGGRVSGTTPSGAPICLLTTIGRRTGRRRTVPLLYLPVEEGLAVLASKGGMSTHPSWYLNLVENPRVSVQSGDRHFDAMAREATADERARMWPQLVSAYEHFEGYRMRTNRLIPLLILAPINP
jgi:deazaflavin-dependent oxidoreductase (nitroreductase family)